MYVSTRFPEAIPLRSLYAKNIVRELVRFFSLVCLPKIIQYDQGSNFTSSIFQKIMKGLYVKQQFSSAYHPQSQECVERFHQTLKNTFRMYCEEIGVDWDEAIPIVSFAFRDSVQEWAWFSLFELVYGYDVWGALSMLKEKWLGSKDLPNILTNVSYFKSETFKNLMQS